MFYETALAPWLLRTDASITRLAPRNSPFELELAGTSVASLIPLLAVFLASRTRFELLRFRPHSPAITDLDHRPGDELTIGEQHGSLAPRNIPLEDSPQSLFRLSFGLEPPSKQNYHLQIKSILPRSLIFDFRLDVSTCLIGRLRRILKDLLSSSPEQK